MTQPTTASKQWLRKRDEITAELRRLCRSNGVRTRRRLHSAAAERGATKLQKGAV